MNKFIKFNALLLVTLFFACKKEDSGALQPSDTFVKYYGGTYHNEANQFFSTNDGGFIVAGTTENGDGENTMYIVKVSENGNEQWSKSYSNTNDEEAKSIIAAIDGGYIIASNQVDIFDNQTVFLTKIGESGNVNWRNSYHVNDSTSIEKVIATSSNEYLMIGNTIKYNVTTGQNPAGMSDFVMTKVNSAGDFIETQQWGGNDDDFAYDVVENTMESTYLIVGSTESFQQTPVAQTSVLIAEFGYPLNLINKSLFGGIADDIARDIELLDDGYIICGESQSNGNGAKDVYLLKTSFNIFNKVFENYYGGSANDIGNCVNVINGSYLIGGNTNSLGNGNDISSDAYLIKVDASGNEVFSKTFGSSGNESITDITSLSDEKIIMLGVSEIGGNQQISITKTKSDGTLN